MKKIVLLVIALMLVASVAFAEEITSGNLPEIKGTWTGWLDLKMGAGSYPAELVIKNDTVPVQAVLKLSNLPDSVSTIMRQIADPGGVYTLSSDDGKITTEGSLMFAGSKNFFEFFLKHNKLDGWFYFNGARGDLKLRKK